MAKTKKKRFLDAIHSEKFHFDPVVHQMCKFYDPLDPPRVRQEKTEMLRKTFPRYNTRSSVFDYATTVRNKVNTYILTLPIAFDIETTNIKVENRHYFDNGDMYIEYDKSRAYMYHWQLAIKDQVYLGRYWNEFFFLLECIAGFYNLGLNYNANKINTAIIYIANLGFEFQFIRKQLKIQDVFADKPRKPMKCNIENKFEFRDALRISGGNLESLSKNYCTTKKLTGDLDHTKLRNSETVLSPDELEYCVNDVIILTEYAAYIFETYLKQCKKLPLTKTSIPRECIKELFREWMPDKKIQRANFIKSLMPPTFEEYKKIVTDLYRGGYTHANACYINEIIENVRGSDITSSYPAVLLQCRFPMSKFKDEPTVTTEKALQPYRKKQAFYAKFKFKKLKPLTGHSIETTYKIEEYKNNTLSELRKKYNLVDDNGRIKYIDQATVYLTDLDYEVYKHYYTWDTVEISAFKWAQYAKIPAYVTDVVKHFYKVKAKLKAEHKTNTTEYQAAKELLNSIYGLMVQKLQFIDQVYNTVENEWTEENKLLNVNADNVYWHLLGFDSEDVMNGQKNPNIVLSPYWGVWVTSWARYRLLIGVVYPLRDITIYCDTDSIYYQADSDSLIRATAVLDKYNRIIKDQNKKIFDNNQLNLFESIGTFDPITEDDIELNPIYDPGQYNFCTLGAKRYIKQDCLGRYHVTIAGLNKKALTNFVEHTNNIIFNNNVKLSQLRQTGQADTDEYYNIENKILEAYPPGMPPKKNEIGNYKNITPFEFFLSGWMNIPVTFAQNLTPIFSDSPHKDIIKDYNGNSVEMREKSSIALIPATFKMTINDWYLALAAQLKKEGYGDNRESEFGDYDPDYGKTH